MYRKKQEHTGSFMHGGVTSVAVKQSGHDSNEAVDDDGHED